MMRRWTSLQAVVLVTAFAPASFGQFGGGGMGGSGVGGGGGRGMMVYDFGSAGIDSSKGERCPVRIVSGDGKTITGVLGVAAVIVGCPFGTYEIKPAKVQEVRFTPTQGANVAVLKTQAGSQRNGQVVTTTGEVIEGVILLPHWWRVETDLGMLAPAPEGIKSMTFVKPAPQSAEPNSLPVPPSGTLLPPVPNATSVPAPGTTRPQEGSSIPAVPTP